MRLRLKGVLRLMSVENLSTGIEASASGESLNSGDPAVHPAARHNIDRKIPQNSYSGVLYTGTIYACTFYMTYLVEDSLATARNSRRIVVTSVNLCALVDGG